MYIQTEPTPNPLAMKFLLEMPLLPKGGSVNCSTPQQASVSILATQIFDLPGVENVFLGHDFVTVTKHEDQEWDTLNLVVITTILNFLASGLPVLNGFSLDHNPHQPSIMPSNDPLSRQIEAILEEKVRPAVAQDGGNILFRGFQDGIVYVELQGSCSGCPSSSMTLKMGIENMLKYYIPEIVSVEAISPDMIL
jgi:Fe-S cluster biogenesis protein NfuA